MVNAPLAPDFALRVNGVYNESDGWVQDATTGRDLRPEESWALRAALRWNLAAQTAATLTWDRDEIEFPFGQWSRFENLEKDDDFLLLDPAAVRLRYLEVQRAFQEQLKEGFRKHQVDYLPLPTDEPHAAALRSYLALRMR